MYKVKIEDKAVKFLQTLDTRIQKQIINKLKVLAQNPRPASCTPIKGFKNLYRIRSGDYRIVYQIRDKELLVLVIRIGHRKNIYDRLVN
jgi:mRNA interferase RelE/StbE